ncbi:glycogen synthase GlgA [Rhodomicrobium lacus]|uniref:glycogen synthase GlgA n=1 Tax=Rhodomicrobium lacus TaxID=2498452 RepID=UPI0026E2891B|nr:glycogen synthase GlgA [Rhodomicrobium lacus]WKW49353.1 glycogen synthase GlgA [Rhodomicrobium lacus]
MSRLKVLSAASELYPLVKTGGLADVTGALPGALSGLEIDVRSLVPGYPQVIGALEGGETVLSIPDLFGGPARVLAATAGALDLFVLDAPHLYDRSGNPYTQPDGKDWPDNAFRFAALARTAALIAEGATPAFQPDILHVHDWQAALAPAYLRYGGKGGAATVVTVHNLAFQGQFPAELLGPLGLPPESFSIGGVEHYGAVGFLKAGLRLADRITTVSPSYALEIQQPETGMGLDGLLRERSARLSGILNGIDTDVWNPATDPRIAAAYSAENFDVRANNKATLQDTFGLEPEPGALVVGVVSRLSWQKGLDILAEALPVLLGEGMQLALLGAGDADLEARFRAAAEANPGRVGVRIGYDEAVAHRIQAGSDALAVPSRFEPCGLTQLCALRYGAVPLVARVGGLADTIIDANEMALAAGVATGIKFQPGQRESLELALRKAATLFRDRGTWRRLQLNGLATDVSWRAPARRYAQLYRELVAERSTVSGATA